MPLNFTESEGLPSASKKPNYNPKIHPVLRLAALCPCHPLLPTEPAQLEQSQFLSCGKAAGEYSPGETTHGHLALSWSWWLT